MPFYRFNEEHHHDAEGYLFIPQIARDETIWNTLDKCCSPDVEHIFIRDYNEDGTINGYYLLTDLVEYISVRHRQLRDYRPSTRDSIAQVVKFYEDRKLPFPEPGEVCLRYLADTSKYPHLDFDGDWLNGAQATSVDHFLAADKLDRQSLSRHPIARAGRGEVVKVPSFEMVSIYPQPLSGAMLASKHSAYAALPSVAEMEARLLAHSTVHGFLTYVQCLAAKKSWQQDLVGCEGLRAETARKNVVGLRAYKADMDIMRANPDHYASFNPDALGWILG